MADIKFLKVPQTLVKAFTIGKVLTWSKHKKYLESIAPS
jgi:hypothetical protein